MKKTILILALAGIAAVPALATQQDNAKQKGPTVPRTVHSELMLYQMTNYNGASFTVEDPSSTVRTNWNIRSIAVHPGDRWQICGRPRFRDPCIVLDRSVNDATLIGIDDQIGSARLVRGEAPQAN